MGNAFGGFGLGVNDIIDAQDFLSSILKGRKVWIARSSNGLYVFEVFGDESAGDYIGLVAASAGDKPVCIRYACGLKRFDVFAVAFFDYAVQLVGDGSCRIRIFFYDNDIFVFRYELAGYKRAEQASAQNCYFHR